MKLLELEEKDFDPNDGNETSKLTKSLIFNTESKIMNANDCDLERVESSFQNFVCDVYKTLQNNEFVKWSRIQIKLNASFL